MAEERSFIDKCSKNNCLTSEVLQITPTQLFHVFYIGLFIIKCTNGTQIDCISNYKSKVNLQEEKKVSDFIIRFVAVIIGLYLYQCHQIITLQKRIGRIYA